MSMRATIRLKHIFIIGGKVVVGLDTAKIENLMEFQIVSCPSCESRLRLPSNKGKPKVICPKCKYEFTME